MFTIFFTSLLELALAAFGITLFQQVLFEKSNWQIVRLISNVVLIFSTLSLIIIHCFSDKPNFVELISLLLWIINFYFSYRWWKTSKKQ